MKQFFSLLFLFVFVSGFAFAQFSTLDDGPANVSGKAIVEAPMAPVVFLDQAPNQVNGLMADSSCAICGTLQQSVAEDFTVAVAGPTYGITEVVMWGGYYPENIPNTTDNFTILIHTDAAGSPGAVVDSRYNLQPTTRATTGIVLFGVDEYIFTFDFSASPIMIASAGTYWIEIYNNSVESANFFWETGNLDPTNGIAGSAWATATPGVTWTLDPATELSIQISGDDNIGGGGSGFPELLYYTFDENAGTTTANFADPGVGSNPAPLTGTTAWDPTGQFGSCIVGDFASNGGVETGWAIDLAGSPWTISMWLEIPTDPSGSAMYLFGDAGAGSFRCFHNGTALPDNLVLRGAGAGITDVFVTGIGPAPTVVTFVYDDVAGALKAYKNGVLDSTTPMTINFLAGTGFRVGGYGTSATFQGKMDEFRFYNRALSDAEVAATWNITIVPVELTSFTASVSENDVKLLWETASEINNSGFNVERKSANSEYSTVGFVPGFGTTSEPKSYAFSDNNLRTGVYTYRLKQIDFDGTFEFSPEVQVEVVAPASFSLDQNYPNPFNPSTKITFSLAVNSKVSLKIFDVLGQEVASLVNEDLTAGIHNYDFNATGINSGVYFYRIEATGVNGNEFIDVKKMILVK